MEPALGLVTLVAVAAVVAAAARRLGMSAPLALTGVGVAGSFLPFVPAVELAPEVVLVELLPPLLYAAAIRTPLVDFKRNARPIAWLAVGLVIATTGLVGLVVWWVLPVPFAAALALGAVVAPPDAVAATSIARKVGMPRRVVTILEGESLVNDATALVCLRTAIAALGGSVTVAGVTADFAVAAGGGLGIGLAVAAVLSWVRRRVDDPVLDTTVSLLAPFVAYLPAERIHASGVLAVVVTGLLLGHKSPTVQSAASRIAERTNWATLQFLLESAVFLLIGLQARAIIDGVAASPLGTGTITAAALLVLAAVILLRPLWVFAVAYAGVLLPGTSGAAGRPPWQYPALASWAGMRGVVTLAAAFVIPESVEHRDVLIFLALVVTAGTLLLRGSTLPWLMRRLGVSGPDPAEDALQQAVVLQQATAAGLRRLEEMADGVPANLAEELRSRSESRANAMWERLGGAAATPSATYVQLRTLMLRAEREELLRVRASAAVDQEVLAHVLASLDMEESILDRADFDLPARDGELVGHAHPDGACPHLTAAPRSALPRTAGQCDRCVDEGLEWVHLRMCLSCGNVGCCDSSVGKHAAEHFGQLDHPVMRSVQPGEAWRWCYVDEQVG